ncbi:hypothetical protein DFQ28_010359 [Apophysomyces sp. BC1034]|nr:hypothetical protein DFQ28_010359 [Apophysomyces sp. BC1034]
MHMQYAFEPRISQIGMTIFPKLTRSTLGPGKMNNYYDDVVKSFGIGLKEIDTGDRIVINTPTHTIQRLVSYMNVRSLVGEEVALDPQLIATFTDYTQDLVKVMGLYVATPTWVHQFIIPFVKAYKHHRQVMIDRIIPLVRAKRASTAQGITAPETLMQAFIDYKEPSDGAELTEYEISQTILMVAFASVHTTSLNLGFALAWIMARPDLCKRLEDEIVEAFGNGPVTKDRLDQMQFLDKFLHEVYSQGADKLGIGKRAVQDYTFVNGCQVPKGRLIETTNRAMCVGFNKSRSTVEEMDPDVWGNRKPTNSKNDYVVFGVGKHTCPGRFFATLEVKVALVTMLRKYTVTSLDGKPYRPVKHLLGVIATVPETPFVLTKREKLLGH